MITGVILAGGEGRRMGGLDKGLVELKGRPLVDWVVASLRPQVDALMVIANRNIERYQQVAGQVVQDLRPDYPGPLAGIESALSNTQTDWIVTCPVDTPYLPSDYVTRMLKASQGQATVVSLSGRIQPVFALLPRCALANLQTYLDQGERKVMRWLETLRPVVVPFDDKPDAFRDADSLDDLEALR